ncbi:GH10715 [Drosophila grimshawi]|uniref:GH10715 n=1 Tax=Drosophila grimshawi TaxID=7222 RepID=B4K1V3_DROGR|nr:GH10715 [Drosophila grimshawi]
MNKDVNKQRNWAETNLAGLSSSVTCCRPKFNFMPRNTKTKTANSRRHRQQSSSQHPSIPASQHRSIADSSFPASQLPVASY